MEVSLFETEMKRLKSQWPNSYSDERMKIFFNAFRDVSNSDFREAVTHCLATYKSAPLLRELTEGVISAKNNYLQKKRIEEATAKNILSYAYEKNTTADREFVDNCMKLFDDLYTKKITKAQFDEGCNLLDQAARLFTKPKSSMGMGSAVRQDPYKNDD